MRKLYSGLVLTIAMASACVQNTSFDNGTVNEVVEETYVHSYGVEVPKEHWEEAGQNGQIVTTLKNGIVCKQSYYFGLLEGETTYTFPQDTQIEKSEFYSQNQLTKEIFYYASGNLHKEIIYDQPGHTLVKEWYENGQLKSYEKRAGSLLAYAEYYDPNGTRLAGIEEGMGCKTERDCFGLLIFTDSFKEGTVDNRTSFYPNGSPKEITPYQNGIVHGLRKTYYPGGEPKSIETWAGGMQHGTTTYFVDGQKSQEIPYLNGLRNGVSKTYKDGVFVIEEQTWRDDQLHGPSYYYYEGRTSTQWYYKGHKVTKGYYDSFTQLTPIEGG
jgi:antitoxin component YwqK of YwqJK toxin-antitoxin module